MTKEELHAEKIAELKRQLEGAEKIYRRYMAYFEARKQRKGGSEDAQANPA